MARSSKSTKRAYFLRFSGACKILKKDLKLVNKVNIVSHRQIIGSGYNLGHVKIMKEKDETKWGSAPINRQSFYIALNACLISINKAKMAHAINKKVSAHDKKELYANLARAKFKDDFKPGNISTSYLNSIIQKKDPWGYIEAFQNKLKWALIGVLGISFLASLAFLLTSSTPGKEIGAISFLAGMCAIVYGIKNFPELLLKLSRRSLFLNNLYILKFLKKTSEKLEKTSDGKNNLKHKLDSLLGARMDFPMIQAGQSYWALASDLEKFNEKTSTTMESLASAKETVMTLTAPPSEQESQGLYTALVGLLNNDNPNTLMSYQDGSPTLWLELTHIMDTISFHKRGDFYHITETPKLIGKLEADYIKLVEIIILLLIKEKKYSLIYAMVLEMFSVSSFKMIDDWEHLCDKYHIDLEVLLSCLNKNNTNYFDDLKSTIHQIKLIENETVRQKHLTQIYALIPDYAYEHIGQEMRQKS